MRVLSLMLLLAASGISRSDASSFLAPGPPQGAAPSIIHLGHPAGDIAAAPEPAEGRQQRPASSMAYPALAPGFHAVSVSVIAMDDAPEAMAEMVASIMEEPDEAGPRPDRQFRFAMPFIIRGGIVDSGFSRPVEAAVSRGGGTPQAGRAPSAASRTPRAAARPE